MKFSKMFAFAAVAFAAPALFADAGNTLISFSTKAPGPECKGDVYADGSVVKDGEWYALCWSPNAEFGGLTSTCEAAVEGDRVFLVAPLAEGGRCPPVVFQIDSKVAPTNGNYFVYLLDTRDISGNVAAMDPATRKPALINGVVATTAAAKGAVGTSASSSAENQTLAGGGAAWGESAVDGATVGRPVISSFRIDGDRAVIKVSNLHASVRYNIFTGSEPGNVEKTSLDMPISAESNDTATFYIDKKNGRFFRVGRQPLK